MQHSTCGTEKGLPSNENSRGMCADLLHVGAGNSSVGEETWVAALGLLAWVRVGAHRPIMAEALRAWQHLSAFAIKMSVSGTFSEQPCSCIGRSAVQSHAYA